MSLARALEVAVEAARAAGDLLRADFRRAGGPRGGGDKAEADTEAERLIRARLQHEFPRWGYRGEETGEARAAEGEPVWLVDPNDGTRDYLAGRRGSAVSIGLVKGGQPVLGVVHPFVYPDDAGEMFAWAEGCGPLTRNGVPVMTTLPASLGPRDVVLVSSKGDRDPEGNLRCADPARYRPVPSIAHRLALVACGEAAATTALFSPRDWDYAGGHALLRAMGGAIVDETRAPIVYDRWAESRTRRMFAGSPSVALALSGRDWSTIGVGPWSGGPRPARLERGRSVSDLGLLSRAHGCLFGQIAGDNLGALVEFQDAAAIARRYPTGPSELEDGGHWHLLAGQATDDSEMALALARSIVDGGGFDAAAAQRAYADWGRSAPFDIGSTVRAALESAPNAESQANGSVMRASPLGIFAHALRPDDAMALARADSALTHPHPACGDAAAVFVVAIAHAVRTGEPARAVADDAQAFARRSGLHPLVQDALQAATHEPPVCDGGSMGWVRIALQNAFFELRHASSLLEGVVRTVRRGGDTDTNAAIAGALLGAVHGRDAIPRSWRDAVLSCRPHPLRGHRPRPLVYWPADVMEIAERLLLTGAAATR